MSPGAANARARWVAAGWARLPRCLRSTMARIAIREGRLASEPTAQQLSSTRVSPRPASGHLGHTLDFNQSA